MPPRAFCTACPWLVHGYHPYDPRSITFHGTCEPPQFHILYFEEWLEGVRRSIDDYETPYFYFDPADRHSLSNLNKYLVLAKVDNATLRDTLRRRMFDPKTSPDFYEGAYTLDKCANLRPEALELLVERVGDFFPSYRGFNITAFAARTDESIERIESAMCCADRFGRQPLPSKLRQMSPLVYTCGCRGVGCRK